MPKYLIEASYTAEGAKGVLEKGGTSRRDAIAQMVQDLGGTLEAFYFGFGRSDAYVLVDLPQQTDAAAVALRVGASGAARTTTTVLLTPEEVDTATKATVAYRPPGT